MLQKLQKIQYFDPHMNYLYFI